MSKRAREEDLDPYRQETVESVPSTTAKITHLTTIPSEPIITCSLPGHSPLPFTTYAAYETHYSQSHMNRCQECRRNFPTAHFLALHISERHDSMVAVRRERGEKTYACFVEGCDKVCAEPAKRKAHLMDKHGFPKDYDFRVVVEGVDGKVSLLKGKSGWDRGKGRGKGVRTGNSGGSEGRGDREKRAEEEEGKGGGDGERDQEMDGNDDSAENIAEKSKTAEMNEASAEKKVEEPKDTEMEGLAGAMSSLMFVPSSVRFGRGKGRGRGGFSRT